MKKTYQQIIIICILMVTLANLILPTISYASNNAGQTTGGGLKTGMTTDEEAFGISLAGVIDTAVGFLVYPWKTIFLVPGLVGNLILTEIASVGSDKAEIVTLETILFNKLSLVDINIFSKTTNANGEKVSETIQTIRQNVANWYYAFRNFAIVASFATLLYIGIRMAIDNIAEKRAKYKKMLMNWFMGFALIFVLHYFIIIVLNANTSLINTLSPNEITDRKRFHELSIRDGFWGFTCTKLGSSYFI